MLLFLEPGYPQTQLVYHAGEDFPRFGEGLEVVVHLAAPEHRVQLVVHQLLLASSDLRTAL